MPNRDMSSFVPARPGSQATPLQVVCGSIATTPFRVVCGPTTTTLLPTMIHPSLAAADLPRPMQFPSWLLVVGLAHYRMTGRNRPRCLKPSEVGATVATISAMHLPVGARPRALIVQIGERLVARARHAEGVNGIDVSNRSLGWRPEIARLPCTFQLAPALVSKCGLGNSCNC
jgi:hypothetical protein